MARGGKCCFPEKLIGSPTRKPYSLSSLLQDEAGVLDQFLEEHEGFDVNATEVDFGFTAAHRAAANGHIEICNWLVARGADMSTGSDDGYTPLMMAAMNGHRAMVSSRSPMPCVRFFNSIAI